ncbi:LysR family transcriptional regulator [Enterocloster lavalensis]|uniref:LysR family transcriptional regulator n=1 Tax=Enterocloster lavalensis TaxID=460384 RepID=UPI0026671CA9|nr:LysR family transcriptional regulator [Enterocloster lavalensis]
MELQDLRYFCMAAEFQHITKAAEVLGVSQPFLTKIIRRLEKELGVPLFDHLGRSVALNEYGVLCYKRAKHLLQEADNMGVEIKELYGRKDKVVSMITNAVIYVPDLLSAFYQQHEDYTVLITSASERRIGKMLRTGNVDFALSGPPMEEDMELGIRTQILCREKIVLMMPENHRLRSKNPLYLKDMHNLPLVISPPGFAMRNYVDRLLKHHGIQPRIVIETGEVSDLIQFVRQGIGCVCMPQSMVQQNKEWEKDCFEFADAEALGLLGLSYCELPYMREGVRVFKDFLIKFFCDRERAGSETIFGGR